MEEMVCKICKFWDRFAKYCRKNPPTIVAVQDPDNMGFIYPATVWPDAEETDYCGEWVSKPPKGNEANKN
jgi:hypothetical protein